MEGDVSLSAEDDSEPMLGPTEQTTPVNHGGELEDGPEEHHDWLHGHQTVKFLLAGGIAGAGDAFSIHKCYLLTVFLAGSFQDVYRSVRPSQSFLDYSSS